MVDRLLALIVDESKWLTASLMVALLAVTGLVTWNRRSIVPARQRIEASLFFALTVGTMAFGHLLAVSVKLALGRLEGSIGVLYLIGVALALPSWWLAAQTPLLLTRRHFAPSRYAEAECVGRSHPAGHGTPQPAPRRTAPNRHRVPSSVTTRRRVGAHGPVRRDQPGPVHRITCLSGERPNL
jgi:hypothetical protein